MKLLFDENLSPRLVGLLADLYPGSLHVHQCGLGSADDVAIWEYAKANGLTMFPKTPISRRERFWPVHLQKWFGFVPANARARTLRMFCGLLFPQYSSLSTMSTRPF